MKQKVIIESAYRPNELYSLKANAEFVRLVCLRAVRQGWNPLASHIFYTEFLNDDDEQLRSLGIQLGIEWGIHAQAVWACLREGEELSEGMAFALYRYEGLGKPIQIQRCHPDGELIEVIEERNPRE